MRIDFTQKGEGRNTKAGWLSPCGPCARQCVHTENSPGSTSTNLKPRETKAPSDAIKLLTCLVILAIISLAGPIANN